MGPYRIDLPLDGGLREDLYSMIFASCFRAEYILYYKNKINEKEQLREEAIEEHTRKKKAQRLPYKV